MRKRYGSKLLAIEPTRPPQNLGNNPIKSFSNVQLSKALKFFYCEAVNFTDITIDTNTAGALNSLNVWDRTNNLVGFAISNSMFSNTTNCAKNGGEIKQLFKGKTNYTLHDPSPNAHQVLSQVREGGVLPSLDGENVPAWVKDVAAQCLQLNEYDRPSAIELSFILKSLGP
ncbi:hypothetical protein THRCLA_21027 [Thraustotheca clavata]|uniref:Serine-threonine/tyrosine-protein kinase catalytic domain-containing protein n=1 Tax=Thraustotheca clavata TaxID=74557 RepID=A0A1W0A0W3_9STRA|nr:hypothetical protein THRCLA_21027 [Thraustotheca clavata]